MRVLTATDVHEVSVRALGLDSSALDLATVEVMASCLRRAAGFLCPCSGRTLIHAVVEPLQGLVDNVDNLRGAVEETLEALVAHGDLLELAEAGQDESAGRSALLYLAPPSYVRRQSGALILLGVLPDHISLLPDEIEQQVEYLKHVRLLPPHAGRECADQLAEMGYIELSTSAWLKAPKAETAAEHLARMNRLLDAAPRAGDVPGLLLLDPGRSVRYYRGRWVEPTTHTGRFVGRRAQAYGADLWCYVEIRDGSPVRFVDLPLKSSVWRGCDEAWRIQTAIDHEQGAPQVFRVRPGANGTQAIDFFSPVPMWVRRRWEAVGEPVVSSGCLFSYGLKEDELEEEMHFLKEHAWLAESS